MTSTAPESTLCWINGLRRDPDAPLLNVRDRGFTLADGCFETMRAYGGQIFRLDAHLARLADAAVQLEIPFASHIDDAIADAARVLRETGRDAAIRLTLSRGVGSGLLPASDPPPAATSVLIVEPIGARGAVARGIRARVASGRRNEHAATAGLKTLAYADAVAVLLEARAHGADDAILLDTAGHVSCGTASNVFLIIRGVVHTPPIGCGILPGITRATVLEILGTLDVPVLQAPIPDSALAIADEVFLTSSLREIAPVVACDGREIGAGVPGPITTQVVQAFGELTRGAGRLA
jgi:branched-chain amino acid aminotransferase